MPLVCLRQSKEFAQRTHMAPCRKPLSRRKQVKTTLAGTFYLAASVLLTRRHIELDGRGLGSWSVLCEPASLIPSEERGAIHWASVR